MATLLEMAKDIVMAHASTTSLSKDELLSELREVYNSLSALEKGEAPVTGQTAVEETVPAISKRKAFGKEQDYLHVVWRSNENFSKTSQDRTSNLA